MTHRVLIWEQASRRPLVQNGDVGSALGIARFEGPAGEQMYSECIEVTLVHVQHIRILPAINGNAGFRHRDTGGAIVEPKHGPEKIRRAPSADSESCV